MESTNDNVLKKLGNISDIESNGVAITGSANVHTNIGKPIM
jgi:hypothetical protein